MVPVQAFPVSELATRTGVKVPTIHAYLRQGLLPAPVRAAENRFLYDRRHVEALGLIRMLRERRHLPIETIKELLPTLLGTEGEEEHAFRSGMWEEVLRRYFPDDSPASPNATLTAAARLSCSGTRSACSPSHLSSTLPPNETPHITRCSCECSASSRRTTKSISVVSPEW
jgi:DNA-binding transcriptional MerR regulator